MWRAGGTIARHHARRDELTRRFVPNGGVDQGPEAGARAPADGMFRSGQLGKLTMSFGLRPGEGGGADV
jgi:hypothetical protein